mmetsp:Transcript_34593/g.55272  ORF Transcript_34593/g.55272 Transcript_34593/m.55272 type:complete len:215 (+) Transcript_34593:4559-5203(+)
MPRAAHSRVSSFLSRSSDANVAWIRSNSGSTVWVDPKSQTRRSNQNAEAARTLFLVETEASFRIRFNTTSNISGDVSHRSEKAAETSNCSSTDFWSPETKSAFRVRSFRAGFSSHWEHILPSVTSAFDTAIEVLESSSGFPEGVPSYAEILSNFSITCSSTSSGTAKDRVIAASPMASIQAIVMIRNVDASISVSTRRWLSRCLSASGIAVRPA